ncbi:MAG: ABC transporter substrate-binding protein [Actinobacteria bacterium]|nr:ABC transporter substrate-binding protein [Actinomycetota bacterium]
MDMKFLDPANVGQSSDHAISFLVYSALVKYKPGGLEVAPDLATDMKITDGGKVYTFTIRQGVKWHKGYGEVTAEDLVYSMNRIKDPATKSRFRQDVDIIDKVEAVDKYTVRYTLKNPFSPFVSSILAFRPGWIVNQKAIEERGDKYPVDPIGSGPYMFESWSRGTEVVLSRNPDYFSPLDIDKVSIKVIADDTVAELALKSGDLDISYLYDGDPASRVLAEKSDTLFAKGLPGFRTQWAAVNIAKPAVKDIRVRKALIHAIDKKATAEAVYKNLGTPVSGIFNPNIPGFINPDPYPYDPATAKALLAEAGVPNLAIKVLVMPSMGWPEMAAVMQDQWKKVGINAELIIRERAIYDQMSQNSQDWDIDAKNISRADAFQYATYLYGPSRPFPNNQSYDGADAIIDAAAKEPDTAKQLDLWKQFQQKVIDDVAGFGMTNVKYVIAWRKGFDNVDGQYQDSYPVAQITMS